MKILRLFLLIVFCAVGAAFTIVAVTAQKNRPDSLPRQNIAKPKSDTTLKSLSDFISHRLPDTTKAKLKLEADQREKLDSIILSMERKTAVDKKQIEGLKKQSNTIDYLARKGIPTDTASPRQTFNGVVLPVPEPPVVAEQRPTFFERIFKKRK